MASGSSGRLNPGSKGFDFASDDILCPYEDYVNQDSSNGNHNEPVINSSCAKDFHKGRMGRSSMFPSSAYGQPEDSFNQEVISTVERSMKKYTDNLMRFLEGISSRMSQLELYCYNLDKSIGEMRSDLIRDHSESNSKLKSLEKHLQEVHRSVQILRDKQELAEAQKELAKLQLVQKESSSSSHSQSNEERTSPPTSDSKKTENTSDTHNQQLALDLPHQVALQQQPVAPPPQAPSQNVSQQQAYYFPAPNPSAPTQHTHGQYVPSESQYRTPQLQDIPRVAPQPTQAQVNQTPSVQHFPQYQQQLPQQVSQQVPQSVPQQVPQSLPQQVPFPHQSSMQTQNRPPSPAIYPTYPPNQPPNPSSEALPSSMPMQVSFSGITQQVSGRAEPMPYGYSGAGRTVPQQSPPQQIKGTYGAQPGDGYAASGPNPALPPGSTYMIYDTEGGRSHYQPQVPPHFTQGGYPPMSVSLQNPQATTPPGNLMVRNPQYVRNHPYGELIEKLSNMGFRSDHVANVIQRMEESGQHIDFNAVLDRLSMH